jgi:hypothetical protein
MQQFPEEVGLKCLKLNSRLQNFTILESTKVYSRCVGGTCPEHFATVCRRNVGLAAMRGVGGEIEAGHRSAPAGAARPLLRFNAGSQPSHHGAARHDERFGQWAGAATSSRATSPCSPLLHLDTSSRPALVAASARFGRDRRTHARANLRSLPVPRAERPGGRIL